MALNPIFAYTDYRQYLFDFFQDKKQSNKGYSLRVLADHAGFKARDYLLRVMNGQRNLSIPGIEKLSKYFKFSEKQEKYFRALVLFNQANSSLEKEKYFHALAEIQKYGQYQPIRKDQFEYFSAWHHSALRSLLPMVEGQNDYEVIGKYLDPPLTAKQVKDSFDLMLRLGFVERNKKGILKVSHNTMTTGDEVASLSVSAFHKATMELAKRSIDKHPANSRDLSGLTMTVSQNAFKRIKSEIQVFRKKIMAITANDVDEDMIYQLNMHLFPLTRKRGQT